MLQQTRVAVVVPYYERFLKRFADVASLARAAEHEVLALWSGLGYYSRARNMLRAAREVIDAGGAFPSSYEGILQLPGIGEYTAAAIASIAFDLPFAAVDGNVLRVMSRLLAERSDIRSAAVRSLLAREAQRLLSRRMPGDFNQAMMELGATVCVPRQPLCNECPVRGHCAARQMGIERELPVRLRKEQIQTEEKTLLIIRRRDKFLMRQRDATSRRLAGFWELPEATDLNGAKVRRILGEFRHSITRHRYICVAAIAGILGTPRGFSWVKVANNLPLTTIAVKALRMLDRP
jgi:A/G-specific adenine glycosylase